MASHAVRVLAGVLVLATLGDEAGAQRRSRQREVITSDAIKVTKVPLNSPGENNQLTPVLVADDPKGGFWVAWAVRENGYTIRHFGDDMSPDRDEVRLPDQNVLGLYGHDDGSLAFTSYDREMTRIFGVNLYLSRISAQGETVFKSKVRGDPGANLEYEKRPIGLWHHPDYQGPVVPIAFNGRFYGLFYVVLQKFEDKSCHTGDEFVADDFNGKVIEKSRSSWNASHSFWQSIVVGADRNFYGITISDPIPYSAVRMGRFSGGKPAEHVVLWPRKPTDGFPPETKISAAFRLQRGFAMAISTGIPKELEDRSQYSKAEFDRNVTGPGAFPVLLTFNESGAKATATYLTDAPSPDAFTTGARLGKNHAVVLWGNGPEGTDKGSVFGSYPTNVAVLNAKGELLQEPIVVEAPLTWHSDATTLSDGSVVWGAIPDDWTPVNDASMLYLTRIQAPTSASKRRASRRERAQ